MNQSFYRKIGYLAAIIVLLFPMAWLGTPSTKEDPQGGGKLSRLRSEAKLGQADLGAIDPASETMRLATLGARGIAVTMLWTKANDYKKTEDWTNFQATLEQLARLQPYFIRVWRYQAWNLSYNVSVELDDVRNRFYYVKQGIKYLEDGIQYLRDNPPLLDDLGWFCGNKVGRADEHVQYRRLFKADDEMHPESRLPEMRDNWLVSKAWYEQAISAVDDRKQPLGTMNPVTFFDSPAKSQMSYAEAIEEEGIFGPKARSAWREGGRLWRDYGLRDMRSTMGFLMRLADLGRWEGEIKKLKEQLDELDPGLEERLQKEAEDSLSAQERRLIEHFPAEPTVEENELYQRAAEKLNITPEKIAARIAKVDSSKAAQARRLANEIDEAQRRVNSISTNREVANFEYWEARCELEQTPETLSARERAYLGRQAFRDGDLEGAKDLYDASFEMWAAALEKVPTLRDNTTMGGDLMDIIDEYNEVLEQLEFSFEDKEIADNFPLWDILVNNDQERKYAAAIEAYQGGKMDKPVDAPRDEDATPLINPAEALIPPYDAPSGTSD